MRLSIQTTDKGNLNYTWAWLAVKLILENFDSVILSYTSITHESSIFSRPTLPESKSPMGLSLLHSEMNDPLHMLAFQHLRLIDPYYHVVSRSVAISFPLAFASYHHTRKCYCILQISSIRYYIRVIPKWMIPSPSSFCMLHGAMPNKHRSIIDGKLLQLKSLCQSKPIVCAIAHIHIGTTTGRNGGISFIS